MHLSSIFNKAIDYGLVDENPVYKTKSIRKNQEIDYNKERNSKAYSSAK